MDVIMMRVMDCLEKVVRRSIPSHSLDHAASCEVCTSDMIVIVESSSEMLNVM